MIISSRLIKKDQDVKPTKKQMITRDISKCIKEFYYELIYISEELVNSQGLLDEKGSKSEKLGTLFENFDRHKAAFIQKYGYLFQEILISLENNLERDKEKLHTIQNRNSITQWNFRYSTSFFYMDGEKSVPHQLHNLAVALTEIRKNSLNILYIIDALRSD
ncbi:hypothetical protein ACTFIW_008826 [Dictyostelium discoideum]